MIKGTVTRQGKYADGEDICEIYVSRATANGLPHEHRQKTLVSMRIGEILYQAGVHETEDGTVWISSVLHREPEGRKVRLVEALNEIGVKKGDKVRIEDTEDGSFLLGPCRCNTA